MPVCKECHSRISKFDKDRCPICGCLKPLEGTTSETIEITSSLDLQNLGIEGYKPVYRKTAGLLFCLLGFTGAGFFYMKFKLRGLLDLLISLVIIGGVGSILSFVANVNPIIGFLIPVAIVYLVNIIFGIYVFKKHDLKEGEGEFLK